MHQHDAALQVPEELGTLAVTAYFSVDEIVKGRNRDLAIGDGFAAKPAKEGMGEQAVTYGGVFVGTLARVAGGVDHFPLALHDMQGAFDDAPIVVALTLRGVRIPPLWQKSSQRHTCLLLVRSNNPFNVLSGTAVCGIAIKGSIIGDEEIVAVLHVAVPSHVDEKRVVGRSTVEDRLQVVKYGLACSPVCRSGP